MAVFGDSKIGSSGGRAQTSRIRGRRRGYFGSCPAAGPSPPLRARRIGGAAGFCTAIAFAASLIFAGCSKPGDRESESAAVNLKERFVATTPVPRDMLSNRDLEVTRRGVRRKSLILIAPVSVRASLGGVKGKATLKGWAAPVFNVGDGIRMDVFIHRAETLHPIGARYFDAGREAEDRDWIPIEYDLDLKEGDRIEIKVSGGPQGDLTADWLALGSLGLTRKNNMQ